MTPSAVQATSNLYSSSPVARVMRGTLRTLQHLWPSLSVRLAYRIFGTPLPPRWLQRHRAWPGGWRSEQWPFERAGVAVHWPEAPEPAADDRPVALLVHGWGGHARQMLPLAQALAARGIKPVLLDLPAHGEAPGSVSNLAQFARAIDYAAARLAQQAGQAQLHAVAAHSLGANALAFAAGRGLDARRLVLLAPPASPHEYTRLFAHVFGLSERTRAALQTRIEAREGILMRQFEPASAGPRIARPTLVVHDRGDRVNRFADGEAFAREIGHARLIATEGLGHRHMLKDDRVLADVADFITGA